MQLSHTKSIDQLIPDIQELLSRKDGWVTSELGEEIGREVAARLRTQFSQPSTPSLRLSQMGPRCPRALWYSIHHPELAEPLPPWTNNKFAFGNIVEAWTIALAKAAGHDVQGEQDLVTVDGISGHRDCVIDGCLCDIKSAASRSFQKFKEGTIRLDDSFGYLDQLDGYMVGSLEDPIVKVKDRAYLIAVDKQLGHICKYEHFIREESIRNRIADYRRIVSLRTPPSCTCQVVAEGKSGNLRLDPKSSYSSFKFCCFPHLRTFLYASGPVYLTKVVRTPDVPEIDKCGNIVYNG